MSINEKNPGNRFINNLKSLKVKVTKNLSIQLIDRSKRLDLLFWFNNVKLRYLKLVKENQIKIIIKLIDLNQ